jgi:hypothetical protein
MVTLAHSAAASEMRVLDLDLDFFVDKPAFRQSLSGTERLPSDEYHAWTAEETERFLEVQCGLSQVSPVEGRVIVHHHEAFHFWHELTDSGKLRTPFEVVHVDSHADLGFGDAGWAYLMGELLSLPLDRRSAPKEGFGGLNAGNFLAFALACRWLASLTYVHHPRAKGNDLLQYHFKDFDTSTNVLELKECRQNALDRTTHEENDDGFGVISKEPQVRFSKINGADYSNVDKFDYVVLAKSPTFTPQESDQLIPVIQRYMRII